MTVVPRSLVWQRLDTIGAEQVLFDDQAGLFARGTMVAAIGNGYTCRYVLLADPGWASVRLEVTVEGAGWLRNVKLDRAAGRWHITAGEQGDLDPASQPPGSADPDALLDALDVDLGYCPLTNTLPIRRLSLLAAPAGTSRTITAARVRVPSLVVVPARQTYTVLAPDRIRYSNDTVTADLTLNESGYVTHYPGLATCAC